MEALPSAADWGTRLDKLRQKAARGVDEHRKVREGGKAHTRKANRALVDSYMKEMKLTEDGRREGETPPADTDGIRQLLGNTEDIKRLLEAAMSTHLEARPKPAHLQDKTVVRVLLHTAARATGNARDAGERITGELCRDILDRILLRQALCCEALDASRCDRQLQAEEKT